MTENQVKKMIGLPPRIALAVQNAANVEGITFSEMIRRILAEWIKNA